jgi:hypothetical protein
MRYIPAVLLVIFTAFSCKEKEKPVSLPTFTLKPIEKFHFKSFVDCNMAEAWIGDTFRIFPGKYGEDPLWGDEEEFQIADRGHADGKSNRHI